MLEQTPNQYEKLNTQSRQWTLERLRLYLKEYHQIEVSMPVSIIRSERQEDAQEEANCVLGLLTLCI